MFGRKNDSNIIDMNYKPQHLPKMSYLSWWLTPDPDLNAFKKVRNELTAEIAEDLRERHLDQYSSLEEPAARIKTRFEMALVEQIDLFLKYCSLSAVRIRAENETRQKRLKEDIDILNNLSSKLSQHITDMDMTEKGEGNHEE